MSLLVALLATWILTCAVVVSGGHGVRLAERARPPRFSLDALACWAREVAAHALIVPIKPLGWLAAPPPRTGTQRPVLLVPGFFMNRSCWVFLATWLRRRGWDRVHAINNRPFNGRIDLFAHNLGLEVRRLREATGAERIDIVGHSMGGMVAAHWILHQGGDRYVNRLVTLGTPLEGSKMAVFSFLREGHDLLPDSEIVRGMGPLPCESVHIWSDQDHLVVPAESAHPSWAATTWELAWMGHLEMLTNLRAFRAVGEALRKPSPQLEGEE